MTFNEFNNEKAIFLSGTFGHMLVHAVPSFTLDSSIHKSYAITTSETGILQRARVSLTFLRLLNCTFGTQCAVNLIFIRTKGMTSGFSDYVF